MYRGGVAGRDERSPGPEVSPRCRAVTDDAFARDVDHQLWIVAVVALDDQAGRVRHEVGRLEGERETQGLGGGDLEDALLRMVHPGDRAV